MVDFFATHQERLERAVEASRSRGYWSPHPEQPSGRIYGETAKADAAAAFQALRGRTFELDQPADGGLVGKEVSPWGPALDIRYPAAEVETLVAAARAAMPGWADAAPDCRAGIAVEILQRLNALSFLMAEAVMHTTGQAFPMAFQAGGPHAQDRGLEAVAYAWDEMRRVPARARWEKPQGKAAPLLLEKEYRLVPRGVALVIGCATFPTWNSYPGLFASLVTGNAVIVKPHPMAILPLALTVRIGREVLAEAGFDPNLLLLAADEPEAPITKELALHPEIRLIDFTGSPAFGHWLRSNARADRVYTEEAGVNPVVIDGTDDFAGMCRNLAFSLSLYSGQMCTAPQNIFVPMGGIATDEGPKSFEEVADGIARAIDRLLEDPERAAAVLGAIQSEATLARVREMRGEAPVIRDSAPLPGEAFAEARTATPLLLRAEAGDTALYFEERFGPIAFLVRTEDTARSLELAARSARARGAITAAVYATDAGVLAQAADAFAHAGVALACNLTGGAFVNQSAAFSDYHVSGANPAGTACLTDTAFVADRFRIVSVRRPLAA
ncbi:MAG TPA: phenylacetic acid degradation protein PaaN [Geminicoccaceae bacterium]|nr:phenylacetic acid degradation protein PaaN [Geminicoccaceae bacterium]